MIEKIPGRVELTPLQLNQALSEIEGSNLSSSNKKLLTDALRALVWLQNTLEQKKLTIKKLLRIFLGKKTETQSNLLGQGKDQGKAEGQSNPPGAKKDDHDPHQDDQNPPAGPGASTGTGEGSSSKKGQGQGHGKQGKIAFLNAVEIPCPHVRLHAGDLCPECSQSKLCALPPGSVLHIVGQAPLSARVYQPEKLRCPSCGAYFVADLPEGVDQKVRHDPTANASVALYKYGSGLPFYRNSKLHAALGIPLPASTQWDMVERAAQPGWPIYQCLMRRGAQLDCIHHDDTKVKILSLMKENESLAEGVRRGIQTTGLVCTEIEEGGREIALFISGRKHAGENLGMLLAKRARDLPIPLQVADALAANTSQPFQTILVNCMDHARREFMDVEAQYEAETAHLIRQLGLVYHFDSMTKEKKMPPGDRLAFHRIHSGPVMGCLKEWSKALLDQKRVEPNSSCGQAIRYLLNHWGALNQFLTTPGAPLSNAAVERLLKTAILHRKNSLFYKTLAGAWVGDVLMSLIQTAIRAHVNPFHYLTQIQKFKSAVFKNPDEWLPWNYLNTLATGLQPAGAAV